MCCLGLTFLGALAIMADLEHAMSPDHNASAREERQPLHIVRTLRILACATVCTVVWAADPTTPVIEAPKASEREWFGGKGMSEWSRLTGDWNGYRTKLEENGAIFTIWLASEVSDALQDGQLWPGIRRVCRSVRCSTQVLI